MNVGSAGRRALPTDHPNGEATPRDSSPSVIPDVPNTADAPRPIFQDCPGGEVVLRHAVMKFGRVIGSLMFLNLAAVVYLVVVITRGQPSDQPAPDMMEGRARQLSDSSIVNVTNYVRVPVTNQFHWSQLESEEYREYIANLRAIGCPEQTIRDIIISDLDLLWSPRLASIYPRRENLQYWHSEEYELRNNYDQREFLHQERAVDREKRDVIRELVDTDLAAERMKLTGHQDEMERKLTFLDVDKRMDVRDVWERFQDEEWAIQQKVFDEGVQLNDGDREALRLLREERDAELSQLLDPQERNQFDLWMSPVAEALRHDLYGMQATEQEFLDLYKLRREFEEKWNPDYVDFDNPKDASDWAEAQAQLEIKIKESLGEDRYKNYARGQDEDFHLLNSAVSRYDLDRGAALQVYDFKRALESEMEALFNDPHLTARQRDDALAEMNQATKAEVRSVLGESAYNYFRRRSNWLR